MRRAHWFAAAVLAIVSVFALWFGLRSDQPYHKGKSLSTWMEQHAKAAEEKDESTRIEAETAIRSIGTNALPTLLRWITKRDSAFRQKLIAVLPLLKLESANAFHSRTTYACGVLGSIAKPMVPDLIALLKDPDPYIRSSAAFALDCIGPAAKEAIPALLETLVDKEAMNNVWAALSDLGAGPETIVAASLRHLSSASTSDQGAALWAIGQCTTNARAAVPRIVPFLTSSDLGLRMLATNALDRIEPERNSSKPKL